MIILKFNFYWKQMETSLIEVTWLDHMADSVNNEWKNKKIIIQGFSIFMFQISPLVPS